MSDASEIPASYVRANTLIEDLLADPELGGRVRARAKEKFPDAGFKFVEDRIDPQVARLEASLKQQADRSDALEAAMTARTEADDTAKRGADFQAQLASAKSKYRLTEDGFNMAVERMRDTKSYDADAAAAWAAMQNPVVKEPSKLYLGPQNTNFFGEAEYDEKMALLHKDPSGRFIDNELTSFLNDPDQYVRDAGFAA